MIQNLLKKIKHSTDSYTIHITDDQKIFNPLHKNHI